MKAKHIPIQTSIALVYETGGSFALTPDACVVIVSSVVTPRLTRAGTASLSIQKLTHDTTTSIKLGMYKVMSWGIDVDFVKKKIETGDQTALSCV
ncbi:hypothetical protein M514_17027 [Trichuris suis]|uniref:Uncharacterized protein n=1 Tax=Trichuris suis TaxID=68888 RepID=A0A085NN59_9BILA|nr:hypothetical protein M514_17027 [Trichuris suis]